MRSSRRRRSPECLTEFPQDKLIRHDVGILAPKLFHAAILLGNGQPDCARARYPRRAVDEKRAVASLLDEADDLPRHFDGECGRALRLHIVEEKDEQIGMP